jgi:hypothetical protein
MDAVQIAKTAFAAFYPVEGFRRVMLEEVDESEDRKFWIITLGYDDKREVTGMRRVVEGGLETYRAYKSFRIDKATGAVRAMKVRQIA